MNNIKRVEDYKRKFSNETKEADYCKRNLSIWEKKNQPTQTQKKTQKNSKPIKTNNNHQIFEHSQAKPKLI